MVEIDERFLEVEGIKETLDNIQKYKRKKTYAAALGTAEGCMQSVLPILESALIKSKQTTNTND